MKISDPIHKLLFFRRFYNHIRMILVFFVDYFGIDNSQRSFRKYLKMNRKNQIRKLQDTDEIVLIESLQISSNNVALALFLDSYSSLHKVQLKAYRMIEIKKFTKLKAQIRHRFSILRALGAKKLLICGYFANKSKGDYKKEFYSDINTLEKLEDFQINGIHIGDLIYDLYLTRMRRHTVDFESPDFWDIFNECLGYFTFWIKYFERNKVKAICISHCVYNFAIPARIAIDLGVEVFQVQSESIHRLDKNNIHAYLNSINLKKEIDSVPKESLKRGLLLSRAKLARRFSGNYVEELELSTGIAFRPQEVPLVKRETRSGKLKILIATHDFFDAVHFFGKGFYPDFYAWMKALSEISHKVDYQWYVKIHPDARGGMPKLILDLAEQSNNWQVISTATSHYEIFDLGIDLVLTVHGTIATEYPYFGIPVMNATTHNPYSTFDFSITPESREEYEYLLSSLVKQKGVLKSRDISEYQAAIDRYFYGRHILSLKSWIYLDYGTYLKDLGGWEKSMSKSVYRYFLSGKNQISKSDQQYALRQFITSYESRLERRHFPSNSAVNEYLN
jgi:hypothetical protein